jgi:SAM-dependent methyltransferase
VTPEQDAPEALRQRVREMSWYHTMELTPDLTTDGWFDIRPHVHHYGLPERMDGMRVLDVGTWDGFWAFEMERRGADVVALDVEHESEYDWPPRRRPEKFAELRRGDGFRLAKEVIGSNVERVHCNIYDAFPEDLGTFDLVFVGTVLVHLRDQLLALERFANLCHGRFIFADEYDRPTSLLPIPVSRYHADRDAAVVFWLPSRKTWKRMLWTAGFDDVQEKARFTQKIRASDGSTHSIPHTVLHAKGRATPQPG